MPCPAHHRVFLIDAKMYLFYVIAFVLTVHKFKQFIDNRLEKLPVSPTEKIHSVITRCWFMSIKALLKHIIIYRRNLGYWPTMYMILEATIALLSLPRFISQRPSNSYKLYYHYMVSWKQYKTLITVTRNLFSSSSCIAPLIDPIAQHSYRKIQISQIKQHNACIAVSVCSV